MYKNCTTCSLKIRVQICDYSQGGCRYYEPDGDFICLGMADNGLACLMHMADQLIGCERWKGKEDAAD